MARTITLTDDTLEHLLPVLRIAILSASIDRKMASACEATVKAMLDAPQQAEVTA